MRTHLLPVVGLSLLAGLAPAGAANAQQTSKKPSAGKPAVAAKPQPAKKGAVVLGTTQLPGDFGRFGQTYTVGRQIPLNFTLRGAEYTIARFNVGENAHIPTGEQKLLVLHYTVHNPNPSEQNFDWNSLKFTAVDGKDVNHEYIQAVTREGTTELVDVSLKPAQKLDVQAAILVPAVGVVPKLIVQREEGAPVVRYDLRGKVKPLPVPVADPADPSGATARKSVPAQVGTYYPYGAYDIKLDSVAYTRAPLGDGESAQAPEEGKRYVVFTFTLRNATNAENRYYWANFAPELQDANGDKVEFNQSLLKATKNETAEGTLKPGEGTRLRVFFPLPDDVAAGTLKLAEWLGNDPSHAYVFDLSAAK